MIFYPSLDVADESSRNAGLHTLPDVEVRILILVHQLEIETFVQGYSTSLLVLYL